MTEKKEKEFGIGGKLNILGLEIDLGKLLSGEGIKGLEELRENLKKLGGKEVLSDEEWKAGGVSVEGHIRTSGIFGEREFDLGVKERKTYRAKPGAKAPEEVEVREPFVDVFYEKEDGEYVKVMADIPGVEEKDIKINIEGKKLTLSAETLRRKYHKDIELDYPVESEFKTNYRNGILEVTLTKKKA